MGGALRDVTKVMDIRYRAFKAICKIQIAGKRYPFDAKMPNRCVAAGCSSTASPGIALYKFPNDPVLRKQWERQVQRTRAKWTATECSVLCSKHFTAECFEESATLASQFGISYKRSISLVRGALPTIFLCAAAVATAEEADYWSAPSTSSSNMPAAELPKIATNKRSAVEKRKRALV